MHAQCGPSLSQGVWGLVIEDETKKDLCLPNAVLQQSYQQMQGSVSGSLLLSENLMLSWSVSPVTGPKRFSATIQHFSPSDSPPTTPPALAEKDAKVVLLLPSVYLLLNPHAHGRLLHLGLWPGENIIWLMMIYVKEWISMERVQQRSIREGLY